MRAPADRPVPWDAVARVLGPGLALLGVLALIAIQPGLVEAVYAQGPGAWIGRALGAATGWLPFSLAEWIEALVVGWVVLAPLPALRAWVNRQRSLHNVALHGLAQLLVFTVIALIGFYLTWGLNYARAPLVDRLGWARPDPSHPLALTELILLADDLVDAANDRYLAVHGSTDAGVMTAAPGRAVLDRAIEAGWEQAVPELGLGTGLASPRPRAKPLLSSPLFSRFGISGFYFPFTGEANYNAWTPGWQLPLTIAHEKAHQRGFASEDEANFVGYVVCSLSPDPLVQYAGVLFAQRQLLFALLEVDPAVALELVNRRHPGVQRDVTEAKAFWESQDGRARVLSQAVNDTYLRANRVSGGVDSYNRSTELILAWAHVRGLTLPVREP